ncbi:MAG: hypothetical protein J0H79_07895 [Alphaproteobacteria bacterium]|jgi:hypothetical protein|nr:hypothetical protein [Alphaproteobacteria bacterium]
MEDGMLKSVWILAVASVFPLSVMAAPAASGSTQCLQTRDVASFSQGGRLAVVATAKDGRKYDVAFRNACPYHLNSHFVYEQWKLGRCLTAGDALPISTGGACIVASVKARPAASPAQTPAGAY